MVIATVFRLGALSVTLLLSASCAPAHRPPLREFGTPDESANLVSMVSVLADPSVFDSHQIRVQAVLHLEFEGDRICLDRDSALDFVPQNCVRLSLSEKMQHDYSDIKRFSGQ